MSVPSKTATPQSPSEGGGIGTAGAPTGHAPQITPRWAAGALLASAAASIVLYETIGERGLLLAPILGGLITLALAVTLRGPRFGSQRHGELARLRSEVNRLERELRAEVLERALRGVHDPFGEEDEEFYNALVSAANQGVWLVESDGQTIYANETVGQILGMRATTVRAGNLLDFVDDRDRESVEAALKSPQDTPDAFEARFRRASNAEVLCLMSVSPGPTKGPSPVTLCLLTDITAVQRDHDLRRGAEQRFRSILNAASEGIWTQDRDGMTTFVNDAAANLVGAHPNDMIGHPIKDFIEDDTDAVARPDAVLHRGLPERHETRLRRRDGKHVDVVADVAPLRNDQGDAIGSVTVVSDFTQLKAQMRELQESRERFAQVFEESPVGMVFFGVGRIVRGRILGTNRAFRELLGYTEEELLDHDLLAINHPEDEPVERALATALLENERDMYVVDKHIVRADGREIRARFQARLLRDVGGAPLYGIGVLVDIERSPDVI